MAAEAHFGATTAWHCEYDRWPSAILAHRWPGVPNLGNITTADWAALEPVDILTAGYPCQPFSHAGKRQGTDDARHIWPHVAAAVRALRPRHVVLENVAGHLSLGFGDVLGDLAALGYDARWVCVRAADVGAPHGRLRVFIHAEPADAEGQRRPERRAGDAERPGAGGRAAGSGGPAADADGAGLRRLEERDSDAPGGLAAPRGDDADRRLLDTGGFGPYAPAIHRWERVLGRPAPAPTQPGRGGPRLNPAFVEWMMGLPDGWVTQVPGVPRSAQLKALGNGVVPQQAAYALALLDEPEAAAPLAAPSVLLPTPAVNDMGAGKTPEAWDEWTAAMQAKHGNGNGHGRSLAIEAARLAADQ